MSERQALSPRSNPLPSDPLHEHPVRASRCTQRQTVERETPISFAIRAPLMTIVAFSASSVSRVARRRSVVPGRDGGLRHQDVFPVFRVSKRVVSPQCGTSLLSLKAVHKQTYVRRAR